MRSDHGALPVLARLLSLVGPLGAIGLLVLAAGVVAPAVAAGGIVVPGEKPAVTDGLPRAGRRGARARRARVVDRVVGPRGRQRAPGSPWLPLATLRVLREGPGELGT